MYIDFEYLDEIESNGGIALEKDRAMNSRYKYLIELIH